MNDLHAQVRAENNASKYLNELVPLVQDAMRPFIGKKLELLGGGFVNSFEKPEYKEHYIISKNRFNYGNDLYVRIHNSEQNTDGSCTYAQDVTAFVGQVDDRGILMTLEDFKPHKTDYDAETILNARKRIRELETLISEENQKGYLYLFGKH